MFEINFLYIVIVGLMESCVDLFDLIKTKNINFNENILIQVHG